MAVTQEQRDWLSKVIKFSNQAPTSDVELLELRLKNFLETAGIAAKVQSTNDQQLIGEFQQLDGTKPADEKELQEAIGKAKDLRQQAVDKLRLPQEALLKKLKEYQPKLLSAKTIVDAINAQPKSGDLGVATKKTGTELSFGNFDKAKQVVDKYDEAIVFQTQLKFPDAINSLDEGVVAFNSLNTTKQRADLKEEVAKAKSDEEHAFRLFVGDEKDMRKLVASPDVLQLLQGGITNSSSPALQEMQRVFEKSLERFDKLKVLGVKPYEAADIAFANIPRAFWPDRAIREIDMFLRVEQALEVELAEKTGEQVSQGVDRFMELYDYPKQGADATGDELSLVLKMQLKIPGNKKLPEKGTPAYEQLTSDQKKLIDVNNVFDQLGKGTEGVGLLGKAINVISLSINAHQEDEGPVQKKIAEYQRNVAIYDIMFQAEKFALNIAKDVIPALGAVTSGVDMFKAALEAVRYFKMLSDINNLKEGAKRDPESVVYLPLIRMAKLKRIQGAEKVLSFVENALLTAGKITQLSGVGAAVGLAVDVSGKLVAQGGKFVFANIKWSDAKKAQKNLLKAKGPPIDREAIELVFKYSNRYATCCLAIAAIEEKDPWAIRYCINQGLTEEEVKDENTSIQVLRKYIVVYNSVDDEQKTFSQDTLIGKGLTKIKDGLSSVGDFLSDKAAGRDLSKPYESPETMGSTGLETNPNYKELSPPQDLKRETWHKVKTQAKDIGWYDDRSKLGDELDAFNSAQEAWYLHKKGKDKFIVDPEEADIVEAQVYGQAIHSLNHTLACMRPLANDLKTIHQPMQNYIRAMIKLVDEVELEFQSEYFAMSEVFNLKELKSNKQGKNLQELVEARKKKIESDRVAVSTKLKELIKEQAWDSPFGACKLGNYLALVCKQLSIIEDTIKKDFNEATENLESTVLYLDANDILGSYPVEDIPKAFLKCLPSLQKTAKEALTTLAVVARAYRDRGADPKTKLEQEVNDASLAEWQGGVSEALNDGIKTIDDSEIVEYLGDFETQRDKYKKRATELNRSAALSKLSLAVRAIAKLEPVDHEGLPYQPMLTFCDEFVAKLNGESEKLKATDEKGWEPTVMPPEPSKWADWWDGVKKDGEQYNLVNKSTGVAKAVKAVASLHTKYADAKSNNQNLAYDEKIHTPLLSALDTLAKCVQKFQPVTKGGKSLPGAVQLKQAFLNAVIELRKTITDGAAPPYKSAVPTQLSDVTEDNWSKAKTEYVKYGMVETKTGLAKAIKGFVSAKAKYDKAKPTTIPDYYDTAARMLVKVARTAELKDAFGRPFEQATQFTKAIADLVDATL